MIIRCRRWARARIDGSENEIPSFHLHAYARKCSFPPPEKPCTDAIYRFASVHYRNAFEFPTWESHRSRSSTLLQSPAAETVLKLNATYDCFLIVTIFRKTLITTNRTLLRTTRISHGLIVTPVGSVITDDGSPQPKPTRDFAWPRTKSFFTLPIFSLTNSLFENRSL